MPKIKKAVIGIAAFAVLGTGYCSENNRCRKIPEISGLFTDVVIRGRSYDSELLERLRETADEGIAAEMIEAGHLARKRINNEAAPAPGFSTNPYDLRIEIKRTPLGDEAYLADLAQNRLLPVYEGGHVGDLSHRLDGIELSAEKIVSEIFDESKKAALEAVEKSIELLR